MGLKIKQLKQHNEVFVPITAAEAVLVRHKGAIAPLTRVLDEKVETIDVGKNTYINCTYQDFKTKAIDKLQIRKEENDIGVVVGEGDNTYIIQDNFLVYGKHPECKYLILYHLTSWQHRYQCLQHLLEQNQT